jgi:thioester reductase-like protein
VSQEEVRSDGVLLTGATGFVGMELLARYLERTDRPVYVLVRGASERAAATRVERTLACLFGFGHPYAGRVTAVRGDVTRAGLGLRHGRGALTERVNEVVHSAASVSFDLELDAARAINVDGTRRVLEFAERCRRRGSGLRRFSYVSTAYVAGRHSGYFSEDDLNRGQRFRNTYEQSKFEAERTVAQRREQLPITVLRPSIIVGARDSGWTSSFNVLYWPLRVFARGAYAALPARGEAPVDVVPVDYVADATFALSQAPEAEGATFHLTAGDQATSVGELVELASAFFKRPAPRLIDPLLYRRLLHPLLVRGARDERHRRSLRRSETFFPYFDMDVRYDDRRARVALRSSGIEPTPLPSYFDRLVQFALAADWGRRELPRARAAEAAAHASSARRARRPRSTRRALELVR